MDTTVTTGRTTGPVKVLLPSSAKAYDISADQDTTHILTRSGDVLSFGKDSSMYYGQFGTSQVTQVGPVYAEGSHYIALSSGANSVLTIDVDGKVWAWGSNARGQLGMGGDTGSNRNVTTATNMTTFNDNFVTEYVDGNGDTITHSPTTTYVLNAGTFVHTETYDAAVEAGNVNSHLCRRHQLCPLSG